MIELVDITELDLIPSTKYTVLRGWTGIVKIPGRASPLWESPLAPNSWRALAAAGDRIMEAWSDHPCAVCSTSRATNVDLAALLDGGLDQVAYYCGDGCVALIEKGIIR